MATGYKALRYKTMSRRQQLASRHRVGAAA